MEHSNSLIITRKSICLNFNKFLYDIITLLKGVIFNFIITIQKNYFVCTEIINKFWWPSYVESLLFSYLGATREREKER